MKKTLKVPQRLARRAFLAGAASLPLLTADVSAVPADASVELQALIDRCFEHKAAVEVLKQKEQCLLPEDEAAAEIGAALDDAFEAMWDSEDAVNAFAPRSIADLRLKACFLIDHMYCAQSAEHGSDVFAWNLLRELAGREGLPAV